MAVKTINRLTTVTKWIALITMILMMCFITVCVISRTFFVPIIGDIEIVQLGMVILIMGGLAYAEQMNSHISIGLIVDKFPQRGQKVLDAISSALTMVVTLIISYVYIQVFLNHKNELQLSTGLLDIPYYPFDLLIFLGFLMWGLEAGLKFISNTIEVFKPSIK